MPTFSPCYALQGIIRTKKGKAHIFVSFFASLMGLPCSVGPHRSENLFKQLEQRSLTAEEQAVIDQRVQLQRKMYEAFERQERARKVGKAGPPLYMPRWTAVGLLHLPPALQPLLRLFQLVE
jgi:hypothetical protein